MKPHTRKLYQLVRAKLHLGEHDGIKFIDGIQAEVQGSTQDFVRQTVAEAKSELVKWMFIFWVGQGAVTYMIVSLLMKN